MSENSEALVKEPMHLTLTLADTVRTVAPLANEVYKLGIVVDEYEDRRTYRDSKDGLFTLEVVNADTGSLTWVFKDRFSGSRDNQEASILENPKAFMFPAVIENFAITVSNVAELMFLKDLKKDVRYNTAIPGNTASYHLMNTLNSYNVGSGWTCNPIHAPSTAYFIPRYFGPGNKAPEIYNFNPHAKLLVVVDLLVYGEYKTHALMVG